MAKKDPVSEYLATIGARGGKARVAKGVSALSPEDRSAQGKAGAEARWGKKRANSPKKKAKGK